MKPSDLGTILGVWAHPDDEAYLMGGIAAAARDAGERVVLVTATLGEQGTPDPVAMPPERMAEVRRLELSRCLGILGVVEHHDLGHPDGGCESLEDVGTAEIAEIIAACAPDTILTFGPDGFTGHGDHRAMSTWVRGAVDETGCPARVLHATVEPEFLEEFADVHDGFDVFFAGRPTVTSRDTLAIRFELGPELVDRKVRALRAQASQTRPIMEALGERRFAEWLAVERFAWASDDDATRPG